VIVPIDSISAIFAVTTVPFIVFAANAFAMLGLRAVFPAGQRDGPFRVPLAGRAVILGITGVNMLSSRCGIRRSS
jgi:tellurite resistance protein TerC